MAKMLLGALVGALLMAAFLLESSTDRREKSDLSVGSIETTCGGMLVARSKHALEAHTEKQLRELERLLGGLTNFARRSPSMDARIRALLEELVTTDPIATAELFVDLTSRKQQVVQTQFLRLWVENDGVELVKALPESWREAHPQLYRAVFQALANTLPEQTLPHILAMQPSDLRPLLILNIIYALDVEQMPLLFRSLAELTESEQRWLVEQNSIELANKAPHQLLAWARTLNEPLQSAVAHTAFSALARKDPKSVLELVDDQPVGDKRRVIRLAVRELALSEPQLAVAEAEARGLFFADVARAWAQRDPVAASRWLIEQTPNARNSSHDPLMNIASDWGKRDINAAVAFADSLPEGLQARWINSVAASLARSDPDRLETLANSLSDTPYAGEMLTQWASHRYYADPEGTLSKLLSLEPALRDKPLSFLARHAMDSTPESAARLLEDITDQELRRRALHRVLQHWQDKETGALEPWLAEQASPTLRDEAYSVLARDQPELINSIEDRKLRVVTHLGLQHRVQSTIGLRRLLEQVGLTDAQWDRLFRATSAPAS